MLFGCPFDGLDALGCEAFLLLEIATEAHFVHLMNSCRLYCVCLCLRVPPSIEWIRWFAEHLLLQFLLKRLCCARALFDLRLDRILLFPGLCNERSSLLDARLHLLNLVSQLSVYTLLDPVVFVLFRGNGACN